MRARVVIGANFGDEGKGAVVDYLCATEGADFVVRFNGGAQAGHTVVMPDGRRHVFKHFGSGALAGVPTYLSRFFICNPLVALPEFGELTDLRANTKLYAHPECLVTTFADMIINQTREEMATKRHGSCGLGLNETFIRSTMDDLRITMKDIWGGARYYKDKVAKIAKDYAAFRVGAPIASPDDMIESWCTSACRFAEIVDALSIGDCRDPVFEGAQGLLLDQNNKVFYPHLTRSNTGMTNIWSLVDDHPQIDDADLDVYYVSRTYLTRHGAGRLPGEDPSMSFFDNTNNENFWQGKLRFAPLDYEDLERRCYSDSKDTLYRLVLTHCDQCALPDQSNKADLFFYGPTRLDARR